MSTALTLPRKNMLIGITHTKEGLPIIRESKVLKVGIGLPRGKAADLFVDTDGNWNIRQGNVVGNTGKLKFETVSKVKTRPEAEAAFRKAYAAADLCGYPRKIPYFTFTRPVIGSDGAEVYVPDFAATEAYSFQDPEHSGAPTEIDVVFLQDDPFSGSYAYWSSSELRCSGDGENALRSVQMYKEEKDAPESLREVWKAAKAAGERTFSIVGACWTLGCPFAKEKDGKPSPCKPSGDLKFQLTRNIRVGGTAFFHTSGYRSIIQIFSAVERIKELTGGRIAGIPLKMVLRSYKTNHNGQAALQSGVSLEFRAEDFESVRKNMIEQAWRFRGVAGLAAPARQIESGEVVETLDSSLSPQSMTDEFYPDNDDDAPEPEPVTTNAPATQAASTAKVQEIGEKLKPTAPAPELAATAPWGTDRKAMTSAFMDMKKKIGDVEFQKVLTAKDLMLGSVKPEDPKSFECYEAMQKRAKEMETGIGAAELATPKSGAPGAQPLF